MGLKEVEIAKSLLDKATQDPLDAVSTKNCENSSERQDFKNCNLVQRPVSQPATEPSSNECNAATAEQTLSIPSFNLNNLIQPPSSNSLDFIPASVQRNARVPYPIRPPKRSRGDYMSN